MQFLWYLLTLLFGIDAQALPSQTEKHAQVQETSTANTSNVQERRGGGTDKLGGHGPIIVVEDTHFKVGE